MPSHTSHSQREGSQTLADNLPCNHAGRLGRRGAFLLPPHPLFKIRQASKESPHDPHPITMRGGGEGLEAGGFSKTRHASCSGRTACGGGRRRRKRRKRAPAAVGFLFEKEDEKTTEIR
ncbi:hypothetical protein RirG_044810 [Rhizophagus irregularis DAOM 197198w]|uniref:Uncharacterized protein n=1 Tax=Rhizophagus irregularis (strain DAOM 197198w) TaxID=1432141 RepID=A0A015K6A9_RHIIW|nr:hypothetical protein RirG_044810 [Rhizophagus irregularis DAOM 197198w]